MIPLKTGKYLQFNGVFLTNTRDEDHLEDEPNLKFYKRGATKESRWAFMNGSLNMRTRKVAEVYKQFSNNIQNLFTMPTRPRITPMAI